MGGISHTFQLMLVFGILMLMTKILMVRILLMSIRILSCPILLYYLPRPSE